MSTWTKMPLFQRIMQSKLLWELKQKRGATVLNHPTQRKNNFQPGTFAKKEHPTDCMKFNFVHTRVLGITFSVTSHYHTTEPPANGERWWRLYTN